MEKWRGLFNPGFRSGYMLECVPLIVSEVNVFQRLLRERAVAAEVFKLEEMTLRLTMDVIGAVAL
jgi:cytochrome P450